MNRHALFTLLIAAFLASVPGRSFAATERAWLKYSEIAELFEKFESVQPERRSNLVFRVKAAAVNGSLKPSDITLSMDLKRGRVSLPVDAKGVIAFPLQAALREEDPVIHISTPTPTKVALIVDVLITLPPQSSFKYADMMTWVKHAGDGVQKHAGIWALFMPKPDGLELEYPPGQPVTAKAAPAAADRSWSADANGKLVIPMSDELLKDNPEVTLSAKPTEARPHFKVKMQLIPSDESKIK